MEEDKKPKGFVLFDEVIDHLDALPDDQFKRFILVMRDYKNGLPLNLCDPIEKALWSFIKEKVDRGLKNYKKSVNNGKLGGRPKGGITMFGENDDK